MGKRLFFTLLEDRTHQDLIQTVSESYQIVHGPPTTMRGRYFDSFDWLLYKANLVLFKQEDTFYLEDQNSFEVATECPWQHKEEARFWWDFPDCELKTKLNEYLDVRALLPFLSFVQRHEKLHILNNDEKTVLLVYLDELNLNGDVASTEPTRTVTLDPVRGYEKEFRSFHQFLERLKVAEPSEALFDLMLKQTRRKPGDYSSKVKVALTGDMSGSTATRKIMIYLLNVMKQNEDGVIRDIDTEFLHDFRVSGRRTRSALSQIKDVFPYAELDRFKQDFRVLGQYSNKLRDLDVYLHNKAQYLAMLPENLRHGLDPFFMDLEKQRENELIRFIEVLRSDFYRLLVRDWEAFLGSDAAHEAARTSTNAEKPVITLARAFIWRRYKKIMKDGAKIDNNSLDEKLHSLRIQCKKLRYLLEFFTSLFPSDEITLLTKQLKQFQDNLGELNDLSVQQKTLNEYLDTIVPESDRAILVAAAIGGLITNLNMRQQHVRAEFSDQFRLFGQKKNTKLFKQLFKDDEVLITKE
ncbi:CHAD domain-containing protein [Candidatus Methanophagaceae archaeon]|nr:CHAD domain-containing protein [Methanophagales archaeon]